MPERDLKKIAEELEESFSEEAETEPGQADTTPATKDRKKKPEPERK